MRARREFDAWTNDLLVSGTNRTRQTLLFSTNRSFERTIFFPFPTPPRVPVTNFLFNCRPLILVYTRLARARGAYTHTHTRYIYKYKYRTYLHETKIYIFCSDIVPSLWPVVTRNCVPFYACLLLFIEVPEY